MNRTLNKWALNSDVQHYLREDGLALNVTHLNNLPKETVQCTLEFKSPLTLAGLPWFFEVFASLGGNVDERIMEQEGREFRKGDGLTFELPCAIALSAERVALNLIQRASAVASHTKKFVTLADPCGIAILDTRKTTPGLRALEKYAVTVGGGGNHRFLQTDMWMVKDNHKSFFGGIVPAVRFFQQMNAAYTPLEVEAHSLDEFRQIQDLKVRHIMLDNFSPGQVAEALKIKREDTTIEVSGGITLENLTDYLIKGVDFISVGALTQNPPVVDLSLRISRL